MKKIFIVILSGFMFTFAVLFIFSYVAGTYKNYNNNIYNENGNLVIVDESDSNSYKRAHFDIESLISDLSKDQTISNNWVKPKDVIEVFNWFNQKVWKNSGVGLIQQAFTGNLSAINIFSLASGLQVIYDAIAMPIGLIAVIGTGALFVFDTGVSYMDVFLKVFDNGYIVFY